MADQTIAARFRAESLGKTGRFWWWLNPLATGVGLAILAARVDEYLLYVATSWIAFGLLGTSLSLVWGQGGFLSLGQTAFYGIGGYVASVVAINFTPLTGNNLVWILPVGAFSGAIVAALVGYFIFFGRLGPVQGTILTYTFTLVLWTGSIGLTIQVGDAVVGGDNGMSNIPALTLAWGDGALPLEPLGMFLTVLSIAIALFILMRAVLRTPYGLVIDGIRMNDAKTEMLGYDIRLCRLVLFMISGALAGVAGGLFAAWATYINPTVFSIGEALLVPIYVLVGGRSNLASGFIGAAAVGGLSFWLGGGVIGGQTTLALGLILILLVVFLPDGLAGAFAILRRWLFSGYRRKPVEDGAMARINVNAADGLPESSAADSGTDAGESGSVLQTIGLRKAFGGVLATDNVSIAFEPNRIRCLIGPNGAGKSTFLHVCMGLHKVDGGRVILESRDITDWPPFARVRKGLAIKLQVAQVYEEFTVWENLWIAAYSRTREKTAARDIAERVLAVIGLGDKRGWLGGELSHGEQQWLDIGMVLCLTPKVILLDEPTAGMTPEETMQTAALIRRLARRASVVVVDHDMEFVRKLEAEITVLHQGAIFAEGRIEELRRNERVLDIYLGRRQSVKGL